MSDALQAHFANLDGFDPDERWIPLTLINGNEPVPHFESPMIRRREDGFDLRGFCQGGRPGKPQALAPPSFRPPEPLTTGDGVTTLYPSGEILCRAFQTP